jgi:cytochrome P450
VFAADPLGTLDSLAARHGGVVGVVLAGERVVIVSDPMAAATVLGDASGEIFTKSGTAFLPGADITGAGMLTSDGATWRRQRTLATPAFRRAAVEAYGGAMAAAAGDAARLRWAAAATRDVHADAHAVTLAVVTRALFGVDVDGGDSGAPSGARVLAAVDAAFTHLAGAGAAALRLPAWLPTPGRAAFDGAVASLDGVVYEIIAERREARARRAAAGPPAPATSAPVLPCLLDAMLDAAEDAGERVSDRGLRDELVTMLVAGAETSAIALAWAAALLAHHPDVQADAAAEVEAVLGGRAPTLADAGSFPVLEAVLLETLRLMPPAYIVGRCMGGGGEVEASSRWGGGGGRARAARHRLPPGTTILVSPYLMHRSPALWDAPRAFAPSRWAAPLASARRDGPGGLRSPSLLASMGPNGAFMPFGAGPRACIGAGFACLEFVLTAAALLNAASLSPPFPGAPFPSAAPSLTLRPAGAVELALAPRKRR